jgi:release factor glutamine methyltransferase
MKVKELFSNSIGLLKDKGIPTASLDVKVLLSFLLNASTSNFVNLFEKNISDDISVQFNKLLLRRLNREPIANIIGYKSFWDYDFIVNENVLTPRSDSETLIEAIITNYTNKEQSLNILDLGTGSGCLILTLLKIYNKAVGFATDISEKALDIAKKNAKKLNIKNVKFLQNNWNDNIENKFDIIISNPPYISKSEIEFLSPEVNKFNPILALDGGNSGLDYYKYLSKNLQKNCNSNTKIFLEIGNKQENDVEDIFKKNDFVMNNFYKDINSIIRVLEFNPQFFKTYCNI